MEPSGVGPPDNQKIWIAPRGDRFSDLGDHEFRWNQVFDANVMVEPSGKQLIFDLDRVESGGFG